MTDILKAVRDGIMGALLGFSPEQLADEQRQQDVTKAVDRFLENNSDWKPSTKTAPKVTPVTDSKIKTRRIMKALGAGAGTFTPHIVDGGALERAFAKSREVVASDPERYSHIIDSTSLNRIG